MIRQPWHRRLLHPVLKRRKVTGFSLLDIPGLQLWLDANDLTTIWKDSAGTDPVIADGDVVGRWDDKSGAGNFVIQATTVQKLIYRTGIQNGLSIVRLDGINDHMLKVLDIIGGYPFTICAAAKADTQQFAPPFGLYDFSDNTHYMHMDDSGSRRRNGAQNESVTFTTTFIGNFRIGISTFALSSNRAWINGTEQAPANTNAVSYPVLDRTSIGQQRTPPTTTYWDGDIGEIAVWNRALSDDEMNLTGDYLANKFGLTWSEI